MILTNDDTTAVAVGASFVVTASTKFDIASDIVEKSPVTASRKPAAFVSHATFNPNEAMLISASFPMNVPTATFAISNAPLSISGNTNVGIVGQVNAGISGHTNT